MLYLDSYVGTTALKICNRPALRIDVTATSISDQGTCNGIGEGGGGNPSTKEEIA